METIKQQSIEHSLRENFKIYPENYPLQEVNGGISPTEDAISALVSWVENEFENDNDPIKGSINEWFDIAACAFYDFFELSDGNFDETNDTWNYLIETINQYKK
jgi:hypothetical protein